MPDNPHGGRDSQVENHWFVTTSVTQTGVKNKTIKKNTQTFKKFWRNF